MDASLVERGAVLKCLFPYDSDPHVPGEKPHYCLAVNSPVSFKGSVYVVVAYGTSKMDDDLMRAHSGLVLTVPAVRIKGDRPTEERGHFILDQLAILPFNDLWIRPFLGKLDFIDEKGRGKDAESQRLYKSFVACSGLMYPYMRELLQHFLETRQVGLLPGKTLR